MCCLAQEKHDYSGWEYHSERCRNVFCLGSVVGSRVECSAIKMFAQIQPRIKEKSQASSQSTPRWNLHLHSTSLRQILVHLHRHSNLLSATGPGVSFTSRFAAIIQKEQKFQG